MVITKLKDKATRGSYYSLSWDAKVVMCIVIIITAISTLRVTYDIGYLKGQEDFEALLSITSPPGIYTNFDFPYWLNAIHIWVTLGLIVSTAGLLFRKVFGLFLSTLALIWVCIVYAWWYLDTLNFLENTEATEYTRMHDPVYESMFRGATWGDVTVLIIVIVIFSGLLLVSNPMHQPNKETGLSHLKEDDPFDQGRDVHWTGYL
jgi:hypothetical protein